MIKRTEASSLLLLRATFRRGFAPLAILLLCLPSIGFAHAFASIGGETQQDANVTAAEQNFFEGQQLLAEGSVISKQKAIEKFTEAARRWHVAGDKRHEGIALSFVGKVYDLMGEKENAMDFYTRTLALVRSEERRVGKECRSRSSLYP